MRRLFPREEERGEPGRARGEAGRVRIGLRHAPTEAGRGRVKLGRTPGNVGRAAAEGCRDARRELCDASPGRTRTRRGPTQPRRDWTRACPSSPQSATANKDTPKTGAFRRVGRLVGGEAFICCGGVDGATRPSALPERGSAHHAPLFPGPALSRRLGDKAPSLRCDRRL